MRRCLLAGTAQRAESVPDGMPISVSAALPFPGATALRSERLASQFAQSLLSATAGSANLWQGLPDSVEHCRSSPAVAVRRHPVPLGDGSRGLLFVSEPLPTSLSQTAQTSQSRRRIEARLQRRPLLRCRFLPLGFREVGTWVRRTPAKVSATGAAAPVEQTVAPRSVSAADVSHPVAASSKLRRFLGSGSVEWAHSRNCSRLPLALERVLRPALPVSRCVGGRFVLADVAERNFAFDGPARAAGSVCCSASIADFAVDSGRPGEQGSITIGNATDFASPAGRFCTRQVVICAALGSDVDRWTGSDG